MSAADSRLDEAARRVAEDLPALTQEQREKLRALLAPTLNQEGDDARRGQRRAPPAVHRGAKYLQIG